MTGAMRMKKKGMEGKRRLLTVKKKTMELATLCGVKACSICLGPNGEIETWPEQPTEVKAIIESFKRCRNNNQAKKIPGQIPNSPPREFFNLSSAQPSVDDETVSAKKDGLRKVLSGCSDDWLHGFSADGLTDLLGVMELKLQAITARIELLNAQKNSQEDGGGGAEFPLQTFGGDKFEMAKGFQQPLQTVEPIQFPLQTFEGENFEMAKGFQQPRQTFEPIQFPLQNFGEENFAIVEGFPQPLQAVEPVDYGYPCPDAQTATLVWEAVCGGGESEGGVFSEAPMLTADVGQLNCCGNDVNMSAPWEFSQPFEETDPGFISPQVVGQFNEAFGVPDLDCLIW